MKQKRDRLFKRGRPIIRPLVIEENGKVHKDIGLMWVAYKKGSFELFPKGMNELEFLDYIRKFSLECSLLIADDKNKEYQEVGPVAMFSVTTFGTNVEPHVDFFPWATKRNRLGCVVSFLQMMRYKRIGCCIVHSLTNSKPLFDKVHEYGVLNYVGKIPNGDPLGRGDDYLYAIRGKG